MSPLRNFSMGSFLRGSVLLCQLNVDFAPRLGLRMIMEFRKMLRLFRESLDLSLQDVANAVVSATGATCSRQAVSAWEKGRSKPCADDTGAIASLFCARLRTKLVPPPRTSRVKAGAGARS